MKIITEEMRYRKRLCEYAKKMELQMRQEDIIQIENLCIDN